MWYIKADAICAQEQFDHNPLCICLFVCLKFLAIK